MNNPWPQWQNARIHFVTYWRSYGGLSCLIRSPYLGFSVAFGFVCWLLAPDDLDWFEAALAILPSMLGFSIAGFAILLVFSSDRFLRIISEGGRNDSLYLKAGVTFVHFILVQVSAIFLSILGKIIAIFELIGIVSLFYSVATAVAACFVLFDIARVYNAAAGLDYGDGDAMDDPEDLSNKPMTTRRRKAG